MIEATYKAILLSAKDYKENDKLLRLLTVDSGVITALMRGVKKPSAKLRFGAVPLAFCEYTLVKKSGFFVVTSCAQLGDFFSIASDYDDYSAACIMLEVADYATGSGICPDIFISLLRSLRNVLCLGINPYLIATAFIQQIIHTSGYAFTYPPPPNEITTSLELLSLLNSAEFDELSIECLNEIDDNLIKHTLKKILVNFQNKFDCQIKSAGVLKT